MKRVWVTFLAASLSAPILGYVDSAVAQQYFVKQTEQQCRARGGRITVWTNTPTPSRPYQVGECYVPPRIGGGSPGAVTAGGLSGANRTAAALGAAAALLGLLSTITNDSGTPSAVSDFMNSDAYREMQQRMRDHNAALNRRTGDLQDFVRQGRNRRAAAGTARQCPGYPDTPEGITMCQSDIAAALEERAAACTDDGCGGALLKAAATARCTAGLRPSATDLSNATEHCSRYPGDYARLQQMILDEFPWANDPDKALGVIRDQRSWVALREHQRRTGYAGKAAEVEVDVEFRENGRVIHRHRATIDERCLGAGLDATICDLAWKAKDARDRGWAPDTPFNCGRARGEWEGDIVNGVCRLPGSPGPKYDPKQFLARDAQSLRWQADEAVKLWQQADARGALVYARLAEQTFATMLALTTTMSSEDRDWVIKTGLPEIERIAGSLKP